MYKCVNVVEQCWCVILPRLYLPERYRINRMAQRSEKVQSVVSQTHIKWLYTSDSKQSHERKMGQSNT